LRLAVSDIACERGGRLVFAALGFALDGGQALLLTGPNGAGKTSLLRVLAGLLRPIAGSISLQAADPDRTVAEQAHYLGHLDPIKSALTVSENLTFWAAMLGGNGGGCDNALMETNLGGLAALPAGFLSAGQRRRLSMARLIVADRPIWLLDEPTASLDAASQDLFLGLMRHRMASGGIVIAATHSPLNLPNSRELPLGAPAGKENTAGSLS
jgi:heme exporter protein A